MLFEVRRVWRWGIKFSGTLSGCAGEKCKCSRKVCSGMERERKKRVMGAEKTEYKETPGGRRRKRRVALALAFMVLLAFWGCGNRAEQSAQEGAGTEEGVPDAAGKAESGEAGNHDVSGADKGEPGEGEEEKEGKGKEDEGSGSMSEGSKEEEAAGEPAEAEEESRWAGKKVSVCGDSISTFTGYIPENYSVFYPEYGEVQSVEETWWMQVIGRTGMELCRNASYSGSTVSGQSQDNHEGAYACGNQRVADLASTEGSWPDVIIILMGTNDLIDGIPLGSYDGVSPVEEGYIQNFSEAYGLMLDKMHRWYPDAEIYCCTIAEVSRWDEEGETFPFQNEHGLTAKNYNDCIKAVAHAKGDAVIDVYGCGITYENAKEYTSDGTHPNAAGAALIAEKVCEGLEG